MRITSLLLLIGLAAVARAEVTVYPHLLDPRLYPDYPRRAVKPPSWDTFENQTQFVSLRSFGQKDGALVGYAEELEKYTKTFDLGRVVWPAYDTVFANNLQPFADELKHRGLWLFDPWGYVPGSGPGDYWKQFVAPPAALQTFEATLGERWLGMDIGEQDGRYIGGYASQTFPISSDRMAQYLNFHRHFAQMADDLGNKVSVLNSLNFAHYLLKEGNTTLIGSETAQALPNSQVVYAFNRGAGKQYGVPWFGNASIFNRFGWKTYGPPGKENGPTKGTSLNLLKRLLYSHILYNSVFAGFESSWFDGDQLSPVGRIQQAAQQWVRAHGPAGVMHTPVALLLDFASGWTFPRHLYTSDTYRVWGNMPYDDGDFFTHGVLDLLYPGYEDASYFHDERGFMSPTPYGDCADVLLSDAAPWTLQQYPLIIAAGRLRPSAELRDKLGRYVHAGGRLVLTEGNRDALKLDTNDPGAGHYTLIPGADGVERDGSVLPPIKALVDAPLAKPYRLTDDARGLLDTSLRGQMLFDAGPDLALITCRKAPGQYTLGVFNPSLESRALTIASHCGDITAMNESLLDTSERGAVGEFPEGIAPPSSAADAMNIIGPATLKIFDVAVNESGVREVARIKVPAAPKGRALPLGNPASLEEAILTRPTFFQHFDGVVIDWRYLDVRTPEALAAEAGWLRRQGVRVYVDLRSGINLYPDLRLTANDPERSAASRARIVQVMDKMSALGAADLVLCLHRQPENSYTIAQTREAFEESLKALAEEAAPRKITLYLAQSDKFAAGIEATAAYVRNAGRDNLRLAPSLALLVQQGFTPSTFPPDIRALTGLWLASSAGVDLNGQVYSTAVPLASNPDALRPWLEALRGENIALDAVYPDADVEYGDAKLIEATP